MGSELLPFAKDNVVLEGEPSGLSGGFRNREVAGATLSPVGRCLFLNAQTPRITIAVTGPCEDGSIGATHKLLTGILVIIQVGR